MKRTAPAAAAIGAVRLVAPSSRAKRAVLLPDLPPEIWASIVSFSGATRLQLSETSKSFRALFFQSIDSIVINELGTYSEGADYHLRLGPHATSIASKFPNLVRLDLERMPPGAKFSEYVSGLSNLRWLRCPRDARLLPKSLPNPSKLVCLRMETKCVNRAQGSTLTCDDDIVEFTNLSTLEVAYSGENFTGSCFSSLTNIENLCLMRTRCASTTNFTKLEKLSCLSIKCCPFEFTSGLLTLDNLSTSLMELELWCNVREDALRLNSLTNLTTLSLSGRRVPYENMSRLARLRNLKLTGNAFNGFLDSTSSTEEEGSDLSGLRRLELQAVRAVNLSGLTGLTELRIGCSSGIKKGCARNLSDLRSLGCRYGNLEDDDLAEMTSLRSLCVRTLDRANTLTNASVSLLTNLAKLDVHGYFGITERCVSTLPHLKEWKLNDNMNDDECDIRTV